MLFPGDMNNDQYTGEKLSNVIREDIGDVPIALLKDAHHSASTGSNTRAEAGSSIISKTMNLLPDGNIEMTNGIISVTAGKGRPAGRRSTENGTISTLQAT